MSKVFMRYYLFFHLAIFFLISGFVFYATPTADDYSYCFRSLEKSPIDNVIEEYMMWASRYTQVFITTSRYYITNGFNTPYSIWLIFYIIILFLCIFYFSNSFFSNTLSTKGHLTSSFIFTTAIIRSLPTLDESIFWEITCTTYVLPSSLLILLFSYIYKHYNSLSRPLYLLIISFLIFFISGLNQVAFIIIFLFLIGRLLYNLLTKSYRHIDIIILLLPIISGAIILLAPGRGERMGLFPNSGRMLYSLLYSFLSGTQALMQGLIDPYIWGSIILFLPFFVTVSKSLGIQKNSFQLLLVYSVFYLSILYSIGFIHYYGIGEKPVQRLMTIWYILFYIGLIPLITLLSPYLYQKYTYIEGIINPRLGKGASLRKVILLLTFSSIVLVNNPPKAIYDLFYNIPGYLQEKAEFYEKISEQQNAMPRSDTLVLDKFQYNPLLLKTPTDADYGLCSYYGFKKSLIRNKK